MKKMQWRCSVMLVVIGMVAAASAQVPQVINYQGRVASGGTNFTGTGQFKFALVSSNAAVSYWSHDGTSVGGGAPASVVSVGVNKGLFSVLLGDGSVPNMTAPVAPTIFTNLSVWLRVWFSDGTGFQLLAPDQRIGAVGYALVADTAQTVPDGSISSNKISAGGVSAANLSVAVVSNTFWRLRGNAGTAGGTDFIGTVDNQPVDFRVNNARVLRLEPDAVSPNLVGGYVGNTTAVTTAGAVIGGGGYAGCPNVVSGAWGVVGGGYANRAGGGVASVLGGKYNEANGNGAAVLGGVSNRALGARSVAAGFRAKADHSGSFVWADSTEANFGSSASDQFLVRAGGGVGIGTTNPLAALHVDGEVLMGDRFVPLAVNAANVLNLICGSTNHGSVNGISFFENASGFQMGMGYDGVGTGSENALCIYDSAFVPRVRFENGGNVGIGTNNADSVLHVAGGGANTPVLRVEGGVEEVNSATGAAVYVTGGQGGPGSMIPVIASGVGGPAVLKGGAGGSGGLTSVGGVARLEGGDGIGLVFGGDAVVRGGAGFVSGDVLLAVGDDGLPQGKVGVGTRLPVADLHVVGGTNVATVLIAPNEVSSGDNSRLMLAEDKDGTYGMAFVYDGSSNQLYLAGISGAVTNGPHLAVNRDNGHVGIGTLALGTYRLSVGGSIHAEEVVVETGWADYVFDKDYPLLSLEEVRSHIEKEGHLPGIPAASEVQERGLGVGAMQTLQMKKIEELTLYLLKQEDEIKQLKALVGELTKEQARE